MIYLDSSVLLEVYLDQAKVKEAQALLRRKEAFVSSWLLAVEVPTVLRRTLSKKGDQPLLEEALERFDEDVRRISLFEELAEVAGRVRHEAVYGQLRTLDVLHVASAVQLQSMTGQPVFMATFDERLAAAAKKMGLGLAL